MQKQTKRLTLSKETLNGLERIATGGTFEYSNPVFCGGGGGDPSAGFVDDANACNPRG